MLIITARERPADSQVQIWGVIIKFGIPTDILVCDGGS